MDDLLPSRAWWRALVFSPDTWWQAGIFLLGAGATWLLGQYLRKRLEQVTQPGVVAEVPRAALRTTALALIPALLWAWLLVAATVFRKIGMATDLLRPAMLLVGAAALIRASVFVLRHSFSPGSRLKAWEGALTATIWLIVALHILGWLPVVEQTLDEYALTFGNVRISLYNVVSFALLTVLLLLVALWISNAIGWRVAKSTVLDDTMKRALAKLVTFTLATVAVVSAMVAAGIDLTAFAVFGGALGVGIGLGLQRVVSNFVSGFILAFEGSIREGDVIFVGGKHGTVKALHARHIVLHTYDGLDILVPNENLITAEITNWSYGGDRKVRLNLPVQISYADDPETAIPVLVAAAQEHKSVLAEPAPAVIVKGFGDNGVDLELRVWIDDLDYGVANVRSDLCRRIWRVFRDAGITIPFPQRDVRLFEANPAAAGHPANAKSRRQSSP
jgi:small-conductance mechanosensitive channel